VFERPVTWVFRHWLLLLNILMGIYVITPLTAPFLMVSGLTSQAQAVYTIYSTQCHQLPERSYFLFGQSVMYSVGDINAARGSTDVLTLRQFIGNPQMGYKMAWSDRMISLYTSIWIGGLVYALLRRRFTAPSLILAAALLVPILLDGGTHAISDLQGFGQGFRDTNDWLRTLTGGVLPSYFYAGDGLWSFNSLMRMWTGSLAGLILAWSIFPRANLIFASYMR
jgi:uncharacterized membrane protein